MLIRLLYDSLMRLTRPAAVLSSMARLNVAALLLQGLFQQDGFPIHFHEPHLSGTGCLDCFNHVCFTHKGCAAGKPQQGPGGESARMCVHMPLSHDVHMSCLLVAEAVAGLTSKHGFGHGAWQ